ncbi:MAG: hypothetical protein V7459_04580 [Oceanicoccus sp.]
MDNSEPRPSSSSVAKNAFLDELESIKDVLDDIEADVPLLNDVVSDEQQQLTKNYPEKVQATNEKSDLPANILDLYSIFDNDAENGDILSELDLNEFDTNVDIPEFSLQTVSADDIPTLQVADDDSEPFTFPDDSSEDHLLSELSAAGADDSAEIDAIHSAEYQEEQQEFFPSVDSSTHPAEIINDQYDDFDLELLIQEVVDDVIPTLENELRKRLSLCSPELIKRLAEKIE